MMSWRRTGAGRSGTVGLSQASPYSQRQGQRALGRDARGAVAHAASQRQPAQALSVPPQSRGAGGPPLL